MNFNLVTALAALAMVLLLSCAQCQHFAPSVNQNGVWLPNPVQEVKNEIGRMKHRLSFEHFMQKRKQEAYQQVPMLNKIHHMENKIRNIKNALRS